MCDSSRNGGSCEEPEVFVVHVTNQTGEENYFLPFFPGKKGNTQWDIVKESNLTYLESQDRSIFFAIFLVIFLVALAGNVYAIFVTYKRKHRLVQKTCIISLSLSDTFMAIAYAINNLETFSHPLVNWTLGPFLCGFIPTLQIFGVTASSAALVAIALDRYRNVIHATKNRWNPPLYQCILGVLLLWLVCFGIATPMFNLFSERRVYVMYVNDNNIFLYREEMFLCVTGKKDALMTYYICIASLIFLPMLFVFLWLYYNIARLIWTHRKPLSARFKKENSTVETSTSGTKTSEDVPSNASEKILMRKNVHVERKIRTFKIIICLMLTFFMCRLPYWVFNIMRLVGVYNLRKHWIMLYVFNGLALLNCALNPFLYTFLNPTLNILMKIQKTMKDFVCNVCCCCFSNTEFEEFERENPFSIEDYQKGRKGEGKRVKFRELKDSQESYKDLKKY